MHVAVYARQLSENNMKFTPEAKKELTVIVSAVLEALDMTIRAFCENNLDLASSVEPLEQVIDKLTAKAKNNHIERMLGNVCSFEMGLVFSDVLSVLERVSDHCSEIAASMIEIAHKNMGIHEYLQEFKSKDNPEFIDKYRAYKQKYSL